MPETNQLLYQRMKGTGKPQQPEKKGGPPTTPRNDPKKATKVEPKKSTTSSAVSSPTGPKNQKSATTITSPKVEKAPTEEAKKQKPITSGSSKQLAVNPIKKNHHGICSDGDRLEQTQVEVRKQAVRAETAMDKSSLEEYKGEHAQKFSKGVEFNKAGPDYELICRFVEQVKAKINNSTLLDIGCGSGELIKSLLKDQSISLHQIIGIDLSSDLRNKAKSRLAQHQDVLNLETLNQPSILSSNRPMDCNIAVNLNYCVVRNPARSHFENAGFRLISLQHRDCTRKIYGYDAEKEGFSRRAQLENPAIFDQTGNLLIDFRSVLISYQKGQESRNGHYALKKFELDEEKELTVMTEFTLREAKEEKK